MMPYMSTTITPPPNRFEEKITVTIQKSSDTGNDSEHAQLKKESIKHALKACGDASPPICLLSKPPQIAPRIGKVMQTNANVM